MAILDDFTAEIIIDGNPATEYDDDDEPDANAANTVTKYVEAVSGKEFSFRLKLGPAVRWGDADCMHVMPYLEGKKYNGIIMRQRNHQIFRGDTCIIDGEWSGSDNEAKLYKYAFADLETRDMNKHDDQSKLKEKYGELGTLKLVLWREVILYNGEPGRSHFTPEDLGAIPEKALKGRPLDVATTFKVQAGGRRPGTVSTQKLETLPVATFVFKYRTRKALQSLMIIERSPTPAPLEERDPATLTRGELEELVRRQRLNPVVKPENRRGVKRERSDMVASTPKRPLKTSKIAGKTVYHIDSSDDEDGKDDNDDDDGGVTIQDDDEDDDDLADVEVVNLV